MVAAGGDGTINEVLNGLYPRSPPLAVLPLGTANVLAGEIGLPREPHRLAELIVNGSVRAMWPGMINGRRFAMMAGIGFDARVVHDVSIALKRRLGRLAYVLNVARHLTREIPPHFGVGIEGVCHKAASVIVARGRYYGGRFLLVPTASIFKPQLDVLLFPRARPMDMLRAGVALARGRLAGASNVRLVRSRDVQVDGPAGELVQCDGNILCTLPARITIAENPVALVVPQDRLSEMTWNLLLRCCSRQPY